MPCALLCSHRSLEGDLGQTLVWRADFERHVAPTSHKALGLARRLAVDILLVDSDMPLAVDLVRTLRADPTTSSLSILVVSRAAGAAEREFLDAGATEILRLPTDASWDETLLRLLPVTHRREVRHAVSVEVQAATGIPPARATSVNVSARGMLLDCPVPLRTGEQLRVTFRLPGMSKPLAGTAVVVRQAGERQWGLEFLYLDEDGLERLRRFVDTWVS